MQRAWAFRKRTPLTEALNLLHHSCCSCAPTPFQLVATNTGWHAHTGTTGHTATGAQRMPAPQYTAWCVCGWVRCSCCGPPPARWAQGNMSPTAAPHPAGYSAAYMHALAPAFAEWTQVSAVTQLVDPPQLKAALHDTAAEARAPSCGGPTATAEHLHPCISCCRHTHGSGDNAAILLLMWVWG